MYRRGRHRGQFHVGDVFVDKLEVGDVLEEQPLDDLVDEQLLCHEFVAGNVVAEQLLGLERDEGADVVDKQLHRQDLSR